MRRRTTNTLYFVRFANQFCPKQVQESKLVGCVKGKTETQETGEQMPHPSPQPQYYITIKIHMHMPPTQPHITKSA